MSYTQLLVVYTFIYTLFFSIHGKKADVTMDWRSLLHELYTAACGLYISIYFILQYSWEES